MRFDQPVAFSTLTLAFTGEGIPPIPKNATKMVASKNVTAFVAATGEAWEQFNGGGTTEASEVYYWPSLHLCPRDWASSAWAFAALTAWKGKS